MIHRHHSKELKFKVALDAIPGDLIIFQIHKWKKQLLDQDSDIFLKDECSSKPASSKVR